MPSADYFDTKHDTDILTKLNLNICSFIFLITKYNVYFLILLTFQYLKLQKESLLSKVVL